MTIKMIVQKIISFTERLEDPRHPLLGPNLKGLYVCGLWQSGSSKFRNGCYNLSYFLSFLFVISQFVELWIIRHDYMEFLHNFSLSSLAMVCIFKVISYLMWQSDWKTLVEGISGEEISQTGKLNDACAKLKQNYTVYTRIVTYLYWIVVVSTIVTLVSAPFVKYSISNETEPLPLIFSSWFPFDKTAMPGYSVAIFIHMLINIQGGGVVAFYDSNAVAVMVFIKGQLAILREQCRHLFDDHDVVSQGTIFNRIKECHRHHNFILRHSLLFNSLLSPVMFLYMLVCSGMICCSVVQFTSNEATTAQKVWVLQYTTALVSQLFFYCWHSNEVLVESRPTFASWMGQGSENGTVFLYNQRTTGGAVRACGQELSGVPISTIQEYSNVFCLSLHPATSRCHRVDGGVYESEWWRGDGRLRRQVAMLGAKLAHKVVFRAGPFTTLCVPTFMDVIKGSYSFFTLLTQMQDK